MRRRGFWLGYASIAWMIASSIALTGFGLDSVIELAAAVIVVWQHRGVGGTSHYRGCRGAQIVVRRLLSQR